jgi:hypothetical protein
MIALTADDTKQFMNRLLRSEMADGFLLSTLDMDLKFRLSIDSTAGNESVMWSEIRPVVVDHLKAFGQPSALKLVLSLNPEATEKILSRFPDLIEMVTGFTMTVTYSEQQAKVTTGVNYASFTMDKQAEQAFDSMIKTFFHKNGCEMS